MTSVGIDALEARLHERAVARSGLDDFGEGGYRQGLQVMLAALRDDLGLEGDQLDRGASPILRGLIGRLHSQEGWTRFPETLSRPIDSPVLITGMPRTGTTALHRILARDSRFQGLENWLIGTPMIRPPRSEWARYPQYEEARKAAREASAEKRRTHWVDADEYNECQGLMIQTMVTNSFGSQRSVPTYDEWFLDQDQTPGFARLADQLRLIGAHSDKRWLLKNPSHMLALREMLDVFPDTRIIVTHRDPLEVIPSLCNLLWIMRRERNGAPDTDPGLIGPREATIWRVAIDRYEQVRVDRPGTFIDVFQKDLATDPAAVVGRIYYWLGMEPPPEVEAMAHSPAHLPGQAVRPPRAEDYGLTGATIRESFSSYRLRYGLG